MPQASFIARQIADFRDRATFVPFLISVVDGSQWYVGRPHMLTLLAEGILLCEDDFTEIVIPFQHVCVVRTVFDPPHPQDEHLH